jgi:hypothetical protein
MAITITNARLAHGYSGYDHLLDNRPLDVMVGCTYRNLAAAAKAAWKLLHGTQDRRCASAPVILTDDHGNGWTRWTDGTAVGQRM